MADGTTKAISALKPGDKVEATSTKTGKTSAETVAAVEVNHDTDLYDLKVKTKDGVQVIHTTASHLFWDPAKKRWVKAADLKKGEHLKTANGQAAVADGGTTPATHDGWMWDLTIPGNDDHDFYVQAAAATAKAGLGGTRLTAILVHNCNEAIAAQLKTRVDELHGMLAEGAQGRRSTAIIRAVDPEGNQHDVVGWSGDELRALDPLIEDQLTGIEMPADRVAGDAETSALDTIRSRGWKPIAGAANRPVCPWCQNTLFLPFSEDIGLARLVGPLNRTNIAYLKCRPDGTRTMASSAGCKLGAE